MTTNRAILLVEDNEDDVFLMQRALKDAQIDNPVHFAEDGRQAIDYLAGAGEFSDRDKHPLPAVVLLDVGLPGEDGLTLARFVRERYDIGIIMVTGADAVIDRVAGLEVGADDYIAKPFDPRELRARLKSVLRRLQGKSAPEPRALRELATIGACTLNLRSRELHDAKGREVPITAMEFSLLKTFLEHPNQVLSRDQLLSLTRNREWEPFDRSIDIRIARLRRKIEEHPERPRTIKTVRGGGYMYIPRPT
jgi:two-component system phosphate regulon response regulator OmpR